MLKLRGDVSVCVLYNSISDDVMVLLWSCDALNIAVMDLGITNILDSQAAGVVDVI